MVVNTSGQALSERATEDTMQLEAHLTMYL